MKRTGAELFVEALEAYDVARVFGNPGTTELAIMDAISGSELDYVLALHEDIAVGMAAGYAKTRRFHAHADPGINPVGVVNLHVAPGVAHGLGNLFDSSVAPGSGAPIVVTAGAHALGYQHRQPNLHGELVEMADQFTKWSAEVKEVGALPSMLRRAFRVALTPPTGPTFLALPFDVMVDETDAGPEPLGAIPTPGAGDGADVARAADAVVEADDVVLVAGDGIGRAGPHAVEAAVRLAEAAGARVHGEFRLKEISFPTDHDQWAGRLPDGDPAACLDAGAVLFAGTVSNVPTNPIDLGIVPPEATSVHVSADPWEVGKNSRADVAVLGDPGACLDAIAERVEGRLSRETRAARLDAVARFEPPERPSVRADHSDPSRASNARLADAVAAAAPDALVVAEASTSAGILRERCDFEPGRYIGQRGGGLGFGLPASVGAAIAESETDDPRDVLGFIGDGAYLFYPQTLYTAARYGVDLAVIAVDNRNYRVLKDNMVKLFGGDEGDYEFVGMDFEPPVDIPANARSHGARGRLVDDPDGIEDAISGALGESGPTVLDVLVHD